ncbi:MAG TPA: Gfo/Idh/MocA family oxidoreductase, partial [Candidatus Binataceae bacterium]|nr:Gfo/Idh/MocA family oxidoreductase [Candidatus Binataceae bacterium]
MTNSKIRVGIIGANVHYGWGSSAHIPALKALPEFEITAVCTSRQESADETARQFGIPFAFNDPAKLVQHPEVDLVSICVRVPFHHQFGIAALEAGKHLFCEWPLAATTQQAHHMYELAERKGVCHMVGLQARGASALNRARDLIGEGYIGQPLSCTMIVATPNWGTEFTSSRAYLADRSTGATLMTIPGGHSIDALCFCLGEFKEVSSLVTTQRPQVKNVDTGESFRMTSPDQVMLNGILENGALASVHVKGGTGNGVGFLFEIQGTDGDLIIAPVRSRPGSSVQISELSLSHSRQGKPAEEVPLPKSYRWVP